MTKNQMLKLNKREQQILCTACSGRLTYFNIANLHYRWGVGAQTTDARRIWFDPLRRVINAGLLLPYVDHFVPTKDDPTVFEVSYIRVGKIDFRRRLCFKCTRKGKSVFASMQIPPPPNPQKAGDQKDVKGD